MAFIIKDTELNLAFKEIIQDDEQYLAFHQVNWFRLINPSLLPIGLLTLKIPAILTVSRCCFL